MIVQTFLPYQSFEQSLACLDNRRLGKQRVEAMQILNALRAGSVSRWRGHPAVRMWDGWESLLEIYHDLAIKAWVDRGFRNNMRLVSKSFWLRDPISKPPWLTKEFCASHRSNLLRKDPVYYSQFGWKELPNLPYIWPC